MQPRGKARDFTDWYKKYAAVGDVSSNLIFVAMTPALAGSNPAIPAKYVFKKEIVKMKDSYYWQIHSIKNRIAKLSGSKYNNTAIINKLNRKIRQIERQRQAQQ